MDIREGIIMELARNLVGRLNAGKGPKKTRAFLWPVRVFGRQKVFRRGKRKGTAFNIV